MKPFLIAEISSNHNGDLNRAKDMISLAAELGFDAVKFEIPIEIPAEADIELKAKASATSAVSGGFEIILVDA